MAAFAFAMLALGLVLMVLTGWASYAVLLLMSVVIAAVGVASGGIDAAILQALPSRLVGLLEHDLLQAVALYALVGALLRHSRVAGQVFDGFAAALRRVGIPWRACPALAGFGVGMLAAPMNGSVGAGIGMLAHTVTPRWREHGIQGPAATALTAVTATLGVLVPPSLVLLLLGDAMLRAHTEGLTLAGTQGVRVINVQDLIQACTPVAAMLALAWAATAAWRARAAPALGPASAAAHEPPAPQLRLAALLVPAVVGLLLTGVASGHLRAVEAAATAALALLAHCLASGQLPRSRLGQVLDDAMALTGALFALLIAATTLSLVLRAAGCDQAVSQALAHLSGHPQLATLAVLSGLLLMSFILDAFEIVFLVVPIVMPPLLAQVPDAAWVACLTLLVLQAGFLLPPWGYAVVLARAMSGTDGASPKALARELLPYLAVLTVVAATVFACPEITRWMRGAPDRVDANVPDDKAAEDLLRSMTPAPEDTAPEAAAQAAPEPPPQAPPQAAPQAPPEVLPKQPAPN